MHILNLIIIGARHIRYQIWCLAHFGTNHTNFVSKEYIENTKVRED